MDKSSKIDGFYHDMLYFLKTCAKAVRNGRNTMRITPEQAGEFHCPRWEELPKLLLYMDQCRRADAGGSAGGDGCRALFRQPGPEVLSTGADR